MLDGCFVDSGPRAFFCRIYHFGQVDGRKRGEGLLVVQESRPSCLLFFFLTILISRSFLWLLQVSSRRVSKEELGDAVLVLVGGGSSRRTDAGSCSFPSCCRCRHHTRRDRARHQMHKHRSSLEQRLIVREREMKKKKEKKMTKVWKLKRLLVYIHKLALSHTRDIFFYLVPRSSMHHDSRRCLARQRARKRVEQVALFSVYRVSIGVGVVVIFVVGVSETRLRGVCGRGGCEGRAEEGGCWRREGGGGRRKALGGCRGHCWWGEPSWGARSLMSHTRTAHW
ncbi:hypothetical protein BDZ88DRAFT_341370 [Geranomyces variabilis]|nr:hypothetical protein BDZ88DRAFT_341370 [Geranomyces variabilis]